MGCRWAPVQQEPADDAYTLTVLSDAGGQPAEPPPPPWGAEPWQQHGPAHAGNPFDDDAVSGSDGSSPDRRCVRSLLHVALAKGSTFAQHAFRTPYPTPSPDPCYPVRPEPYPASLVPLPVHLMSHMPAAGPAAPATPTTRTAAKRRRNRKPPADGSAPPPRKRERSERQLHPCTLCDKRFKDNYSVNVHMRTHTGEKPFPCIVCGKMFRQKAHLAKHRSTHQPEQWAAAAAAHHASSPSTMTASATGALSMPGEELAVDSNSNNLALPMWGDRLDKCKAPNVWTPSILSPPLGALSSVQ
ncbi:hypothetical protein ONE63_001387 [Megalurothrips usitatus]|uniref:C2H2-type domain-containing protein n=1 Tax=Megalurothrips usitatus TaxID=439358 RepID=A0AAV7XF24_9NEOP|nr:hypothetical protein ONE63_001387 [Megalurothrips usitatus]